MLKRLFWALSIVFAPSPERVIRSYVKSKVQAFKDAKEWIDRITAAQFALEQNAVDRRESFTGHYEDLWDNLEEAGGEAEAEYWEANQAYCYSLWQACRAGVSERKLARVTR